VVAARGAAKAEGDPDAQAQFETPNPVTFKQQQDSQTEQRSSANDHAQTEARHTASAASIFGEAKGTHRNQKGRILAMLRAPSGATVDAMMHATGWQQHSVRGFLAGVVRKKLSLNLVSAATEGGRLYRITDRAAAGVA